MWTLGPPPDGVAEMLRMLELTINRRLDGVLHGNHQGLTPGHGSEPGESRVYQPGDDVRRIDWNVTARTGETHVREQVADRDLTAWMAVDVSATMRFGTVADDKATIGMAAAASVGFLTARNQNRLGAVVFSGDQQRLVPPRGGRNQVQAVLATIASAPASAGPSDLAGALDRVGAIARRRGFVAIISDFAGSAWEPAIGRLGQRHDLLAITVHDPREYELPDVGYVTFEDPATGATAEVRLTPEVRRRFADETAAERERRISALRRAGADVVELRTDGDWLGSIVEHVRRRRVQAVRGGYVRT